jgi:hypothetical protein
MFAAARCHDFGMPPRTFELGTVVRVAGVLAPG